ncbi:MAG TPA: AbrB/MazE/SpoVT family DNA-binding domain-containing protein [Anaerolineales bacterium]|nr:AbrB/MazE/SpoVT family DNA-binding domain-containing protein [Anaerolineales bacterium]
MTIVVKSSDDKHISFPSQLMAALNLREGDEVKAIVEGDHIHIARLDKFLNLRGVLSADEAFDQAMQFLDRAWQSWTVPASV